MAINGYWPNKVIVKLKPGAISSPTIVNPVGILPSFLALLAKLRRENGLLYVQCLDRQGSLFWSDLTVVLINLLANGDLKAALKELRAPLKDGRALSFPKDPQAKNQPLTIPPPPTAKQLVAILSQYVLTFEDGKMPSNIVNVMQGHVGVEFAELVPLLRFPGPNQAPGGAPALPGSKVPQSELPPFEIRPEPPPQFGSPVYEAMWGQAAMGWDPALGADVDLSSIAIIDTGIDANHPQLVGRAEGSDPNYRWDWQGHGTHVAGIIMAKEATVTATGQATYTFGGLLRRSTKGKLVSYKVVSNTLYKSGNTSFYPVDPVLYNSALSEIASRSQFKVVNISMSRDVAMTQSEMPAILQVRNSGKRVVAAAGNRFDPSPSNIAYPAAHFGVIAVGAQSLLGSNPKSSGGFSHMVKPWNNSRIDPTNGKGISIWAPGFNILSTMPTYANSEFSYLQDWAWLGGTSMAAPMITARLAADPKFLKD